MCHFLPVYHLGIVFLGRGEGSKYNKILLLENSQRLGEHPGKETVGTTAKIHQCCSGGRMDSSHLQKEKGGQFSKTRRLDIEAVMKEVVRYKQIAEAKIHFYWRKSLWLDSWRGGVPLPGPFHWSGGLIWILVMWFRFSLQLGQNWLEVPAKIETQVDTWLQRHLSLKGRTEVCTVYIFPLFFYYLSVLHLPKDLQSSTATILLHVAVGR